MRKIILFIVIVLTVYSCSTNKEINNSKHHEFVLIEIPIDENSNQKVNELRFPSSLMIGETQLFMQNKFGKHINEIPTNRAFPMQIWTKVKLFDWTNELFTIGVCGDIINTPTIKIDNKQKYSKMGYNSVIVFDTKNEDCFKENNPLKDSLATYFIRNTNSIKK